MFGRKEGRKVINTLNEPIEIVSPFGTRKRLQYLIYRSQTM